jgi:hypothetical protein
MNERQNRTYSYDCKCGYSLRIFIDFGIPQEFVKCRSCKSSMERRCV